MTSATLALLNGLSRLPNHFRSLLWTPSLKAFSTSLTADRQETPAMKALRDTPYPSTSPDPSIFESWSDEYSDVSLPRAAPPVEKPTPTWSTSGRHHPSVVLENLSWSGKFAEAEEVREELVGMGAPIRHSLVYCRVAWHVLRQRPWPPDRTKLFANWLALLPTFAENDHSTHFNELKSELLFRTSSLDLESVAVFGVILSSKGYILSVGSTVIACLTRYADPETTSRILDEMLAADSNYMRNKHGLTSDIETRLEDTSKHLWSVVVRIHCTTGRSKVAHQVAKRVQECGTYLTEYTYQYLLGKLEADGLHEFAADIRALPGCESLGVAKSRFIVKDTLTPQSILPIAPSRSWDANKAIVLAILKRTSRLGSPTYATDIVPYFDLYKTGVRGGPEVIKLRSDAYQHSFSAVCAVLLAELLHHHRRGQFTHVLWIFEKFFYDAGVPAAEVTRRLWRRDHYPAHMRLRYWALPPRITETTFNLPTKLWPTAYHTALVWTALVQLCDDEEEVFALYDQLLQRSAGRSPHQQGPPLPPPIHDGNGDDFSHPDCYDAAHFRPFLVANTLLRGAAHGLRVLDDMQDRGIAPSARILGTGAALQARYGEPALALRMLGLMHEECERVRGGVVSGSGSDSEELRDPRGRAGGARTQLLIAHTAVLRGLVDRRALVLARRVAEMIRENFEYDLEGSGAAEGGNPRTDAVLRYLRRLEVEGPNAEPEPADAANLARAGDDWQQERYSYSFLKRDSQVIKVLNAVPDSN
ncbi:hypothetical protein BJY52DRAFT_1186813 [Lactarius psammicola]|nr:hypothetical protein BJY52DRAFT_1186813 [Lactarius psammicola]